MIETFAAKRLLIPHKMHGTYFFASDYTLNLYRGCNHGCVYCDTRSVCYQIDRFDQVRHKENCIEMLEGELKRKREAGVIMLGAASDGYNGLEEKLCLTRQALLLFRRYGFGVVIPTKGALIARDRDVLGDIARETTAVAAFSITTAEEELCGKLEPGAPTTRERFRAMEAVAKEGALAGIWMNPMLPFLTDSRENIRALLEETARSGGRFALCHFGMTLREGNREYFYTALEQEPRFRGIKRKYVDAFGLSYVCDSPQAKDRAAFFQEVCKELGLLSRFEEVNQTMGEKRPKQITMF